MKYGVKRVVVTKVTLYPVEQKQIIKRTTEKTEPVILLWGNTLSKPQNRSFYEEILGSKLITAILKINIASHQGGHF